MDFGKRVNRNTITRTMNPSPRYSSSMDNIPIDKLNPQSIHSRSKGKQSNCSIVSFEKLRARDDEMYRFGQFVENIELEATREDRERQVEEMRQNRHMYRNNFNQLAKLIRKNARNKSKSSESYEDYLTAYKFYREGGDPGTDSCGITLWGTKL